MTWRQFAQTKVITIILVYKLWLSYVLRRLKQVNQVLAIVS